MLYQQQKYDPKHTQITHVFETVYTFYNSSASTDGSYFIGSYRQVSTAESVLAIDAGMVNPTSPELIVTALVSMSTAGQVVKNKYLRGFYLSNVISTSVTHLAVRRNATKSDGFKFDDMVWPSKSLGLPPLIHNFVGTRCQL